MKLRTSYLFLAIMTFLAGCASTSDIDSLKNTVAYLQFESMKQNKEIETLKEQSKSQSQEIAKLRDRLDSVYALREGQTNLLAQTSDFLKELQLMRGRFEEYRHLMEKTIKEINTEKELQNARISALDKEIKQLKERPVEPEKPKNDTKETTQDTQQHYDDAQIDFQEKRYASARQKFERFIKDNPDHKLTPNAYFWIGETFYNEKKFEDAILAYETFIKKYPKHDKVRVAMLKQGYSFIELGDKKTGKVILERLIERYPRTQEADLAEKRISELLGQNKGAVKPKQTQRKR